jgi:TetR/AcrR family transcriptional regulator
MHYFASKEAIYRQILLEALADWGQRIENVEAGVGDRYDGWNRVETVIEASFEFFKNNPEIVRLVRREALTDTSPLEFDLGTALRPFFERAVAFFSREMDAGVFRRHDPEHLVLTGYGALLTYFSDSKMLTGLIDRDPYSDEALEARFDHIKSFIRAALEPSV